MEFIVKTTYPEKSKNGCFVAAVFERNRLSSSALQIDTHVKGALQNLLKNNDFEAKTGQTMLLQKFANSNHDRILLVGAGTEGAMSPHRFREVVRASILALHQTTTQEVAFNLTELAVLERDEAWKCHQVVELFHELHYQFDQYKTQNKPRKSGLKRIIFKIGASAQGAKLKDLLSHLESTIKQALALAQGLKLSRDLSNMPANIANPKYFSGQALQLGQQYPSIEVNILDKKALEKLKMGALLGVGQGSVNPPEFVILQYGPKRTKQVPIVLVGKGITFDTGGNSLKSPSSMIGMKYDMCGAATVMGAFKACAELNLPVSLIGLIPLAENMPGGASIRPDDILTTLSGQTVEVLNTDAEGRLILCDALTYAERFKPQAVIDMATLTGACVTALGRHASGLMGNSEALCRELIQAGEQAHDRCWQLPLWEEYGESLKSPFADMANIGNGEAGAITAASFLSRFTKKYAWAHLDIAGTACRFNGKDKGATGRPLPLIMKYLIQKSSSQLQN